VLDTNNYYPERDGNFEALDKGELTSTQLEQQALGSARVVKVFNNIWSGHLGALGRPTGAADRSALPIAGDDAAAKQTATEFLDTIGWDAVDSGTLADSWRQEPGTPVYGPPYGTYGVEAGTPASADQIRQALAEAER
jgi:8-hydroxy-5-deazaflavin:NADPH oxidoreductase